MVDASEDRHDHHREDHDGNAEDPIPGRSPEKVPAILDETRNAEPHYSYDERRGSEKQ